METKFEKWLYVLKNLNKLDRVPDKLREKVFEKLFEVAEIAKFTPEQIVSYEDSLKYYRDIKNSLDTAKNEGRLEGIQEGEIRERERVIKGLLEKGIAVEIIAEVTGLTLEYIRNYSLKR